jgi:hypothetical protein
LGGLAVDFAPINQSAIGLAAINLRRSIAYARQF